MSQQGGEEEIRNVRKKLKNRKAIFYYENGKASSFF